MSIAFHPVTQPDTHSRTHTTLPPSLSQSLTQSPTQSLTNSLTNQLTTHFLTQPSHEAWPCHCHCCCQVEFFDRHKAAELTDVLSTQLGHIETGVTGNVTRDRGLRSVCEVSR